MGDERAEAHASLGQVNVSWLLEPEGGSLAIGDLVDKLIPRFEGWGDERGLAFAYFSRGQVHWNACRFALARADASRALAHAEAAGDATFVRAAAITRVAAALLGASRVEELLADARDLEERASVHPMLRTVALIMRGTAAAMTGGIEEARALRIESFELGTELLGQPPPGQLEGSWRIETLCGDHVEAEVQARHGYERLADVGDVAHRSTTAGHWAVTCCHLGKWDDARRLSAECRETSASDDAVNQVLWRGVEAKLLAREGSFQEAERLALEGIEWAEGTDMLIEQSDAYSDLAEVYRMAGRADDARAALAEAMDRASRKGATAVVDRLQHALDDLP
jgi:tetratricopeptide (TPR) repeat protein